MSKPNFIGFALQDTSNTINTKVDSINTNVTNLDSKISSVDASISTITETVTTLSAKVNSIDTNVNDNYVDGPNARYEWAVDENGNPGFRYVEDITGGGDTPIPPEQNTDTVVEMYDDTQLLHGYTITAGADVLQVRSQWYTEAEYPSLVVSPTATVLDAVIYAIDNINESLGSNEKYTFTTNAVSDFGATSSGINLTDVYKGTSGETNYQEYTKTLESSVDGEITMVYGNCWVIYVNDVAVAPKDAFASNVQFTPGATIKIKYESIYEEI